MLKALLVLVAAIAAMGAAAPRIAASSGAVIDGHASYPEGPLFHDGRLYVAEMGADQVSVFEGDVKRAFWRREGCGPTAIAPYREGFLVLCHLAHLAVVVDAQGRDIREIDADEDGVEFRDPNDCFADGVGGVYFSDPGIFSRDTRPEGSVVHVGADGRVRRVASGLWYPNGVYVDAGEHALYVDEHMAGRVLRYPIGAEGALGRAEVFARIPFEAPPFPRWRPTYRERGPDGLERGPDGRLYVAIYGEGVVLAFDRAGRLDAWIEAATRYVTNIAFAPNGDVVIVGANDNSAPPFAGEVRRFPAAAVRAARQIAGP